MIPYKNSRKYKLTDLQWQKAGKRSLRAEEEGEWTRERECKGSWATLGDDHYFHCGLDCCDGFMGINNAKSYQILHLKYVQFIVCQSYLNKAIF